MSGPRCENVLPPGRVCTNPMRERVDLIGRVLWFCDRCAARAKGKCWQCGKPRQNPSEKAAYCTRCKHAREYRSKVISWMEPEQKRRRKLSDKRRRQKPGYQEKNTAHKRAWMAAHPEKFAEYAAKARDKWRQLRASDPDWWERQKAMQRAAYARRMAKKRAANSLQNRATI